MFRRRKKDDDAGPVDLEAQKKGQSGEGSNDSDSSTISTIVLYALLLFIFVSDLDAYGFISSQPIKNIRKSVYTVADKVHMKLLAQVVFPPDNTGDDDAAAAKSDKAEKQGEASSATANVAGTSGQQGSASPAAPAPAPKDFCGCPGTCTQAELDHISGWNARVSCYERIAYMMDTYALSKENACIGASENTACRDACNPRKCGKSEQQS